MAIDVGLCKSQVCNFYLPVSIRYYSCKNTGMAVPSLRMESEQAIELGQIVRSFRVPVTQAALAERGPFSAEWLSKLESGSSLSVSISKLTALAEALGLERNALVQWIEMGKAPKRPGGPDPDALRFGHQGTEGWPPWLEAKFRRLETKVERLEQLLEQLQLSENPTA